MGLHYSHQFALVDAANNICGWSPTPEDCEASDWMCFNELIS